MITHGEMTVPITTLFDVYFLQALHESGHTRSSLCNLCVLCASVVHIAQKKQPQRHRAHRGCTEKKKPIEVCVPRSTDTSTNSTAGSCRISVARNPVLLPQKSAKTSVVIVLQSLHNPKALIRNPTSAPTIAPGIV